MRTIFRRASHLLTFRSLLMQFSLGTLVFFLFTVWLRIPDAGVLDLLLTLLAGLVIAAAAFGGEAFLLHRLRPLPDARRRILLGALALFIAAILWFGWTALLDHLGLSDGLRVGYLNSRLPASSRNLFSYNHLLQAFTWLWIILRWLGTGILLAVALSMTLARRSVLASPRLLRSLSYWLVFTLAVVTGTTLTDVLVQWTPGHSLAGEMLSLIFRLGTAILIDLTLGSLVLTAAAAILEHQEDSSAPTHTAVTGIPVPDAIQPRTVGNP